MKRRRPHTRDADRPVLIYGATASGKSELALQIAEAEGGVIVNADASQVFDNWQVLTARPGADDLARAPHLLYGHQPFDAAYSVGAWLREVTPLLRKGPRPIIVGGTGLYFKALTEGLVDIPATPDDVRAQADALRETGKADEMIAALDASTKARIDLANPMRVQRAWEVLQTTGRGLADWQADTPPPLLPPDACTCLHLLWERDALNDRINQRFGKMIDQGALEEARANLDRYDPALLSMKAIGAAELIAHLRGDTPLETAIERATQATRQFAKRQRTWGRSNMKTWDIVDPRELNPA